ncbi:polymorphic toxin type 34 domain-containing protein, partial [Escherichia coli]
HYCWVRSKSTQKAWNCRHSRQSNDKKR